MKIDSPWKSTYLFDSSPVDYRLSSTWGPSSQTVLQYLSFLLQFPYTVPNIPVAEATVNTLKAHCVTLYLDPWVLWKELVNDPSPVFVIFFMKTIFNGLE